MGTDNRTSRRLAYDREDRGVEQRQLFAIFFAAVVVAMVVFLLGVLAGKGHGPASVLPAPPLERSEVVAGPAVFDAPPSEPAPIEPSAGEAGPATDAAGAVPPPADEPADAEPVLVERASQPAAAAALPAAAPPKPIVTTTKGAAAAPRAASGGFAVQVLASSDPAKAKALSQKLKARGYTAYVVSDGGDKLYRVRVGHFESRDGAESLKARLVKAERLASAWIVAPPGGR